MSDFLQGSILCTFSPARLDAAGLRRTGKRWILQRFVPARTRRQVLSRRYTFVINPAAGARRSLRRHLLIDAIRARHGPAAIEFTEAPGQAEQLARARAPDAGRVVVAVGGDGTVHEVAAGLIGGRAAMGVIPLGSGNDFARMLSSPSEPIQALDWFEQASPRLCDVGQVRLRTRSGHCRQGFFINSLGIGFEADVAASAGQARVLRGFARYMVAALVHLLRYRAPEMHLRFGESQLSARQFLVAVGNGRSAGGGFLLTPEARIDDGLLDLCRADAMALPRLLRILPSVLRGTHGRFAGVHAERIERIQVDCPAGVGVHADGEILARDAVRIEVEVLPGGLELLG